MKLKIPLPFIGKPGKLPAKTDKRTLAVSNYFKTLNVKDVPHKVDWTRKKITAWGMMNNWTLNDCTCAAAAHMIECWTANAKKKEHIVRNNTVLDAFIALSGYDPKTRRNNNPIFLADALKHWRKNGIGTHKIKAYATVNYNNHNLVRASIYLFGGLYIGLNLPATIKRQAVWEVMPGGLEGDNAPGTFGGHAVTVLAYDDKYLTCISWGKEKKMTWEFWDAYCDESYAIITEDFFKNEKSLTGLDLSTLEKNLLAITKAKKTLQKNLKQIKTTMAKPIAKKAAVKSKSPLKKVIKKVAAGSAGTAAAATGKEASKAAPKKRVAAGSAGTAAAATGKEASKKATPKKKVAAGNSGGHSGATGKEASKAAPKKKVAAGSAGSSAS